MTQPFTEQLPKKRLAAGALLFDERQHLLILKPTYRDGWNTPGGVIESDESPREGCVREIREELGLAVAVNRLLCIEYQARDGDNTENVQFIFYGGILSQRQIRQVTLPPVEIAESVFLQVGEAIARLRPSRLARRVSFALRALEEGRIIYLENGKEVV